MARGFAEAGADVFISSRHEDELRSAAGATTALTSAQHLIYNSSTGYLYYDGDGAVPDQWELYDLQKDPVEMHNLYADPAYAKIVEQLKRELQRLKKQLKDEDQFQDSLPKDDVG